MVDKPDGQWLNSGHRSPFRGEFWQIRCPGCLPEARVWGTVLTLSFYQAVKHWSPFEKRLLVHKAESGFLRVAPSSLRIVKHTAPLIIKLTRLSFILELKLTEPGHGLRGHTWLLGTGQYRPIWIYHTEMVLSRMLGAANTGERL